jgi:hypothetical protein
MQITEVDAKHELRVLASLVYNGKVLSATAHEIDREGFQSSYSYKIAERCKQFYEKYHKAPGNTIRDYIERQITNSSQKEEAEQLQTILNSIRKLEPSSNGKTNNNYLIDRATEYLTNTKFSHQVDSIYSACGAGEIEKAKEMTERLRRLTLNGHGKAICDLSDLEQIKRTCTPKPKSLLPYEGPLGKFFGPSLNRGNFVVFQGPEKSYKSYWLQEICHKSLKEGLRVLFVGIGDMTEDQYKRRFYSRICGQSWDRKEYWYPVTWKQSPNGSRKVNLPHRIKKRDKVRLISKEIQAIISKFGNKYLGLPTLANHLKMMVVGEITVAEIESTIKKLQDVNDWSPDVVVIDYMDMLTPPKGVDDKMTQIERDWRKIRTMASDNHYLVVSGTQSKRSAYKGHPQTRDDVADNKFKTAIVTGMIGICAYQEEFDYNTRRLNWIVCREGIYKNIVSTAACPAVSNPAVLVC